MRLLDPVVLNCVLERAAQLAVAVADCGCVILWKISRSRERETQLDELTSKAALPHALLSPTEP